VKPCALLLAAAFAALVAAAPASASDAFPCGPQQRASWAPGPVQKCDLGNPYAHDRIPVYANPVAHAKGTPKPAAAGYLQGTSNQYFVCQSRFPNASYYHPKGWRNVWWAYTKSDDHKWGWVPEVFFRGGDDNEADAGLRPCTTNLPAPPPRPKPKPPASRCAAYYVIGVRGSGESLSGPYDMSSTVGPTAVAMVNQLHHDHPSAVVQTWSDPYPAASVGKIISWSPNKFAQSMQEGQRLLSGRIQSIVRACPSTHIGVIGYSQGAGVTSRTMRALPASILTHVRMVMTYADTDAGGQTSYAITYNYKTRQFFGKRPGHGIFAKRSLPSALPHKLDFCFVQDIVCDKTDSSVINVILASMTSVHTHYKDFVSDDNQRLTTVVGQESAYGLEH
jgi:hypothetical protein